LILSTSRSRPTKLVRWMGRLVGVSSERIGREFDRQSLDRQLEDPLVPGEVLQPVLAQVPESHLIRKRCSNELGRGGRDQHLAPVAGRRDHGGPVDVEPDVVVASQAPCPVWIPIRTRTVASGGQG
jgi:hypothetical protein